MNQIFVNPSTAARIAECSRNNFSKMWGKEKEHPGTYSFFSVDGKIDMADYTFIDSYGDHRKEALEIIKIKADKKIKPKPANKKTVPKKVIPKKTIDKKKHELDPVIKKRTKKQIEQDQKKLDDEAEKVLSGKDPELADLQKRSAKAKHEKIILDKEKVEMELKKARAELCEIETLGHTLIGYCIALNQNLLDQPRSYIDELIYGVKSKKSKTDLTDIARKPATEAIKNSIEAIRREIQKYKKAIKRVEKLENE